MPGMVPERRYFNISILDGKLSNPVDFLVSNFSSSFRTSLELQFLKEKVALTQAVRRSFSSSGHKNARKMGREQKGGRNWVGEGKEGSFPVLPSFCSRSFFCFAWPVFRLLRWAMRAMRAKT